MSQLVRKILCRRKKIYEVVIEIGPSIFAVVVYACKGRHIPQFMVGLARAWFDPGVVKIVISGLDPTPDLMQYL